MKSKRPFDLSKAMGRPGKAPERARWFARSLFGVPILWLIPIVLLCSAVLFFVYLSFFKA